MHNAVSMALSDWIRARDPGKGGGQVIAQEIPEFQREIPPRVVPQKRVQQRATVHFVDVPVPQVTSQERISERIQRKSSMLLCCMVFQERSSARI